MRWQKIGHMNGLWMGGYGRVRESAGECGEYGRVRESAGECGEYGRVRESAGEYGRVRESAESTYWRETDG